MRLVRQRTYWFPAFCKYIYENGSVFCEYRENLHLDEIDYATSELWLYKAVCIDDQDEDSFSAWSPHADKQPYSLVYLMELEKQGMPYSKNRLVVPSFLLRDTMEEARLLGEEARRLGMNAQNQKMIDNSKRNTEYLLKCVGAVNGIVGVSTAFIQDPNLSTFTSLLSHIAKLLKK